jgi:hypothetical protein
MHFIAPICPSDGARSVESRYPISPICYSGLVRNLAS